MKTARENGIDAFTADVLVDNHGMMRVFHKVAAKIEAKLESGVYSLRFSLTGSEPPRRGAAAGA